MTRVTEPVADDAVLDIESQLNEVLRWLEHTNPSEVHNRAVSDYEGGTEQGTGDWVLCTPQWSSWMADDTRSRLLWIYGIPGAGKTVLSARLIQELTRICEAADNQRLACVYYYCYHQRNQDEAIPFLRWLLCALCRHARSIPANLQQKFDQGLQPGPTDLFMGLESILQYFDRVYVVVDALDESHPRESLLGILRRISGDSVPFEKIRLLATSREYAEIKKGVEDAATQLSMFKHFVTEDIRKYLATQTKSVPEFRRWPEELRSEVEDALVRGARGMFRWAVCQLDMLRRLKHRTKIRAALTDLPRTLEETYERIFSYISLEDRGLVRHCLRWITLHNTIWGSTGGWFSYETLSASVLVNTYRQFNEGDDAAAGPLLSDLDLVKETCGCLLSYGDDQQDDMTLAHYTVREYLESDRASQGSSSYFAMGSDTFEDLTALILNISLQAASSMPLYSPAMVRDVHQRGAGKDNGLYYLFSGIEAIREPAAPGSRVNPDLAFEFLDPSKRHLSSLLDLLPSLLPVDPDAVTSIIFGPFNFARLGLKLDTSVNSSLFILAHLLLLERLDLAAQLLDRVPLQQMWTESLSASPTVILENGAPFNWNITGNIVELFTVWLADSNFRSAYILGFFFDHALGLFDPTKILLYYIRTHSLDCHPCMDDDSCPLRKLLGLGANPDGPGSWCTPLQMAAGLLDLGGIRSLLRAGASPLAAGDPTATAWPETHPMATFSTLRGMTPMEILRKNVVIESDFLVPSHEIIEVRSECILLLEEALGLRLEKGLGAA